MAFLQLVDRAIGAASRGVLYVTLAVVFAILSANVALRYVAGTSLASASEMLVSVVTRCTIRSLSCRRPW